MFEVGEFKGNKVITLKQTPEDQYGFTFGVKKAKMILEHLDDIKKFIKDNEKKE